jgi:hypothetical protein
MEFGWANRETPPGCNLDEGIELDAELHPSEEGYGAKHGMDIT